MNTADRMEIIAQLLAASGLSGAGQLACEHLAGDGSDRTFIRVSLPDNDTVLAVFPSPQPHGMAEAHAAYSIGSYLYGCGAPLPKAYAYDEKSGLVLFEDLGNTHLQQVVHDHEDWQRLKPYYHKAISGLIRLQISGRHGFDSSDCWDTPSYDKELMLTRESGYFHQALWQDYLGLEPLEVSVLQEFEDLAQRAAAVPADFILHRDFQSRNIMVQDERIAIIDFQGARKGPLAYDLASLLIDPYAGLTAAQQEKLLQYYIEQVREHIPLDRDQFLEGYYFMALQRNLQILGAFAFLTQERKKPFFKTFLAPASKTLKQHLAQAQGESFPYLRDVALQVFDLLGQGEE